MCIFHLKSLSNKYPMLYKASTSDCNPDESVQNMTSFMTYLQLHLVSANTYDVKNDVIVQPSYATTDLAQIQNLTGLYSNVQYGYSTLLFCPHIIQCLGYCSDLHQVSCWVTKDKEKRSCTWSCLWYGLGPMHWKLALNIMGLDLVRFLKRKYVDLPVTGLNSAARGFNIL